MTWLSRLARGFGLARGLAFILLVALAALRIADPIPIQELRVRVFDLFQVIHPREATQRPVVIVDIDEKSLKTIGQWPWPRTRVADLITRLTQMGALVVAFDIVFAEPDRMSPNIAADAFRDLDEATRAKLRALPSNDDGLRRRTASVARGPWRIRPAFRGGATRRAMQPAVGLAAMGGDPRPYLLNFPGLLRNVPDSRRGSQRAWPVHHPRRARRYRAACSRL